MDVLFALIVIILIVWCSYNTLALKLNTKDDKTGEILDKMLVRVLQIHNQRLTDLEHIVKEMDNNKKN